ncbi:MAG: DUF4173 domain-containing protein [Propionibacteriaceae bacterium]|nr:DUF4173 domain-containing protein [Propionibacteriaceae bacterium]
MSEGTTLVPLAPPVPLTPPAAHPDFPSAGPASATKPAYPVDLADGILALGLVVLGFLFWDWILPRFGPVGGNSAGTVFATFFPGLAVTLVFLLGVAGSLAYFAVRQVRLSRGGLVGAVLVILGALPYAIYDTTPLSIFGGLVLVIGYVTWHAYAGRTAIAPRLGGLTPVDALNQGLVVPVKNAGAWFAAIRGLARGKKQAMQVIFALVGVVVAVPVIAAVLNLLMSADTRFGLWMGWLGDYFARFDVWGFLWKLALGLILALYLTALAYGNAHRRGTDVITPEGVARWSGAVRKVAVTAVAAPLAILCAIYVVFFAAMGSYLFAGFAGTLPGGFTYAEYARQGFFQLSAVAVINLVVLGFVYVAVRRQAGRYPVGARVLGGVLSALTLLLVATAVSKMALYISWYGLTRLRLYALVAMVVMFIVFGLVGAWHIRAFRVGTPVAVVLVAALLGLMWANPDGIIARYNVDGYLSGRIETIDVNHLRGLSAAAVPALIDLRDRGDATVQTEAGQALAQWQTGCAAGCAPVNPPTGRGWTSWSWQAERATGLADR